MGNYVGEIGKRITFNALLVGKYEFTKTFGWQTQYITIYTFKDAEDNILVWKTTGILGIESTNERGDMTFEGVNKGDTVTCKATVKEHSEYKGTPQTVLTRVKAVSIDHAPEMPTKEELEAQKAKEQRESLKGKDFIWEMPYKQFKEHYSDCETVAGSFKRDEVCSTIEVIIREGRLIPSGVRNKHFSGYEFKAEDGGLVCYRAVSEENARKQLLKDYPQAQSWELHTVYKHRGRI